MATDRFVRRFMPQVGHWGPQVGINQDGSLFAILHAAGLSDLVGVRALLAAHLRDNQLDRSVSDPRVEVCEHFIRQDRQDMAPLPTIPNWYGDRFDRAYRATQGDGSLYRNDLFVTVLMHPDTDPGCSLPRRAGLG